MASLILADICCEFTQKRAKTVEEEFEIKFTISFLAEQGSQQTKYPPNN